LNNFAVSVVVAFAIVVTAMSSPLSQPTIVLLTARRSMSA